MSQDTHQPVTWAIHLYMCGNTVVNTQIEGRPSATAQATGYLPNRLAVMADPPTRITVVTPGWTKDGYAQPVAHGIDSVTALALLGQLAAALAVVRITPQERDHLKALKTPDPAAPKSQIERPKPGPIPGTLGDPKTTRKMNRKLNQKPRPKKRPK